MDVRARCFHYRVYSSGIGPYRLSGKRYPLHRLSDAATPLQKWHSYRPRRGVRSCGPAGSISSCGPSRWVRSCGRQGSFASCGPSRWARSCGPQGSFASCGPSRWVRSCGPERSSSRSSRGVQGGGAVDDNQQQEATSVCATASHHRSGTDQGATPWPRVKREKTAASFTEEAYHDKRHPRLGFGANDYAQNDLPCTQRKQGLRNAICVFCARKRNRHGISLQKKQGSPWQQQRQQNWRQREMPAVAGTTMHNRPQATSGLQ